jgi:arylsulfatase A-like enzyme
LIHGYYACVSYTDAQIGKILKELDRLGLAENTIVVLWGDHGFHLGEHGLWVKHCNFDKVIKAPLIVRTPGLEPGENNRSNSLVQFIDIYPTLCDLTNLAKPAHLDGKSFVNVLKDPDASIHEAVYSRYFDGETVVTQRYAYSEWTQNGEMKANMLYDHKYDPDENINIVDNPDYKNVAKEMKQRLNQKREEISIEIH